MDVKPTANAPVVQQVEIDPPLPVVAISTEETDNSQPMVHCTIDSHPDFSISLDAISVSQGNDYIRNDPDGQHMRLDAHAVFKDKTTEALIYLHYTGVCAMSAALQAVLSGSPDAKTTDFGDDFVHMVFETGDERLKDLERGVFVGAGRFVVEKGKKLTVEYKVQHPPLNWEASATATHPLISPTLPTEVETCLKNARFLHLATCDALYPHVSLMNYTYLSSTPFDPSPVIIMTTNPSSKKTLNLLSNPRVSLLVHDWVTHRPPTRIPDPTREGSPPPQATRSSLASLLLNINTSALSSISATINGTARMVEQGSEEESWCKERHLENNTFGDQAREERGIFGTALSAPSEGDGGASCFIEGEEVRVVVVSVKEGRIADWKGGVKDWSIASSDGEGPRGRHQLVNGVV
ncbi:MAG: hypothetical protein LQ342_003627 [Letrouitia transgressa]|nr:MAG: hypothetical protein LQ342_003627 [Letrouitia transgressa]